MKTSYGYKVVNELDLDNELRLAKINRVSAVARRKSTQVQFILRQVEIPDQDAKDIQQETIQTF
jgi:hypothetical protein